MARRPHPTVGSGPALRPFDLRGCRRESPTLKGRDESPSSVPNARFDRFRRQRNGSVSIRRGPFAPMPGQSDKFGCIRLNLDSTPSGHVGTGSDTGTSESADERRKPKGNDGNRRSEDRSNGHLAWPVETAPRWVRLPTRTAPSTNLKLPTQRSAVQCGRGNPRPLGGEDVNTILFSPIRS